MVSLWWIDGESWCFDTQFLSRKNMPHLEDLFFGDSHFGNRSLQALF
jgi:hypothetical protein